MASKKPKKKSIKDSDTIKQLELKAKLEKEVSALTTVNSAQPTEPDMPSQQKIWRRALLEEIKASEQPEVKVNEISPVDNTENLKQRLHVKKSKKRLLFLAPLLALVIYVGLYLLRVDNYYSALPKFMPWPVAIAGNKVIWLDELKKQAALVQKFKVTTDTESLALNHIIEENLITDNFNKNNLSLPYSLVAQQLAGLAQEFGSPQDFADYLYATYQVTGQDFSQFILEPYLRRLVLQEYLSQDATSLGRAEAKANAIGQKINANELSFAQGAKEFSNDTLSADQGGDLGWFSWGTMLPEFEAALRNLAVGEISPPVRTRYGYHLIKLDEISGSIPDNDETSAEPGSVRASHIFIQVVDFEAWLAQQKNETFKLYLLPLKR